MSLLKTPFQIFFKPLEDFEPVVQYIFLFELSKLTKLFWELLIKYEKSLAVQDIAVLFSTVVYHDSPQFSVCKMLYFMCELHDSGKKKNTCRYGYDVNEGTPI